MAKLFEAIERRFNRQFRTLMQEQSPEVNRNYGCKLFADVVEWSPLHAAAFFGNNEAVRNLLGSQPRLLL